MKISKLFHWLYAILMFLPFVGLAFNFIRFSFSGEMVITSFTEVIDLIRFPDLGTLSAQIYNVYMYLLSSIFGLGGNYGIRALIGNCLTYWTIISIVYLIFDVLMYVPLLAHRWIDKARLE